MGCQQSKSEKVAPAPGAAKKAMKVSGAGFKRRNEKQAKNTSTMISEPDAEALRSARSDFVQRTIDAGEPWIDPVFPPVFASLAKEDRNVDDI